YFKKHSPELALAMWPRDERGNPWEYTFFLRNLKYISIPIKVYNSIVGHKPKTIVQGFKRIKDEYVHKISVQYGSIEEMLGLFKNENSNEMPSINDKLYINIPKEIKPQIIKNQKLIPKVKKFNNKKNN